MTALLAGKLAVITGAGSPDGIGRATARLFAGHGARCALLDSDSVGIADAAVEFSAPHHTGICDVSDATDVARAVGAAAALLGGIDILVNNAGVVMGTAFTDISEAEYDQVMGVNLKGNFLMAQACVPFMRRRGSGSVVCIASIAGQNGGGVFGRSHYAASKAGIMGLAKALGRELATDNIRANAVAAGPVDNNFTQGRMTADIKADLAAKVPLGRIGTSEDIANTCLFLASDMSAFITGSVIDVNGGLHIH